MKSYSMMAAALLAATSAFAAEPSKTVGVQAPSSKPVLGLPVVQGCFKSKGRLKFDSNPQWNSLSGCATDICAAKGKAVAGTMGGNQCFCGDEYPPEAARVDDSNCNQECNGFPAEACGGAFFWTIYNTGLTIAVKTSPDSILESSSSSSSTSSTPTKTDSVVTVTGSEIPDGKKDSGPNTAGIAAGVVVSVVVVAAIIGAVFFVLRRRRNKEIEEEHRRNAAVNSFINGAKPPSSSGGFSITDSRLDPVMAQRRVSNGSIADDQDYSRRILRVTNA